MNQTPCIREAFEEREKAFLSAYACPSVNSRGRQRPEPPCPIRTEFQRDRDRIVYATAFRRLKYKTQVFLSPLGDEYRTRLTHTLEVAQMVRTVARAMRLNEDLAEAIALGHDLGHTPFGHGGETVLKEIFSADFSHNEQSLRVVDILENDGKGLNLTFEVRDGILKHSKGYGSIFPDSPDNDAATAEGRIMRIADIMAYLNHDLDDAIRSGVITESQVPGICVKTLGRTHPERATTMMRDLIYSSTEKNGKLILGLSQPISDAMAELRAFLYENVYRSPMVHKEFEKARKILKELFTFFMENPQRLQLERTPPPLTTADGPATAHERRVCDFIASLTDRHALNLYARLFFPRPQV